MRPSLLIDPTNTKRVDTRLTVTRASTATYFDSFGVMRTAPANELRIDYDPITGDCCGFLIEESRTNLLTYSEQFDNAAWTNVGTTDVANNSVAPNGTNTMEQLIENSATSEHYIDQNYSVTAGQTYAFSVFTKAGPSAIRSLYLRVATGVTAGIIFNPVTEAITVPAPPTTYGYNYVGGGVYRVWMSFTIENTGTLVCRCQLTDTGTASYTGDGVSGLYVWGAQLELGTTPSSYIPTTTVAATRSADLITLTSANFGAFASLAVACTYSQTGNTVTVTDTAHGLVAGDKVYLDFTSGTGTDIWGTIASVTDANTYTVSHYISVSTSGNATRSSGYVGEWYNQSEGTFVVMADAPYAQTTSRFLIYASGSSVGRHQLSVSPTTSATGAATVDNSNQVTVTSLAIGNLLDGTQKTFCYAYKNSDFAAAGTGFAVSTSIGVLGGAVPHCSTISIGSGASGSFLNGHIRRFIYYPKRLSNAEIVTLAT